MSITDPRPHFQKCAHFERVFPYHLINNEWGEKWFIPELDSSYNPDYYCAPLDTYIELITSWPNYTENARKCRLAIAHRRPLRIFWWEGQDITDYILADALPSIVRRGISSRLNGRLGGRPSNPPPPPSRGL